MQSSGKTKMVFIGLGLVYLFCFIGLNRNLDPSTGGKPIIYSDGIGLYDYLPRFFFQHHLKYTEQEHLFASTDEKGHYLNRFFCGTALLEMPFFLSGTLYARLFHYPLDGYSPPFQYAIGFSAVVYALWGFYLLYLLLVRYLRCSQTNALWTVVLTALGTPLIFYTTWFGSFSHVFSFFSVTAFLYRLGVTIERTHARNVFILALLLGLIIIIRPVNAVVILLFPILFRSRTEMMDCFVKKFRLVFLLVFALGIFVPVFIQCWTWYMQTGDWFRWSYRQEGFYFSNPQFTEMLFGFRRGLFVYCPLLLLSIPGIVAGFKTNKWVTSWLLIFLFLFTYITASWWHWTYGDTFGIRPFNDVLPAFMILFAFSLAYFVRVKKIILTTAIVFTVFNLVFAWQFVAGITNFSTMTADKFFSLFFKTSKKYEQLYGGSNDLPPYAPHGFKTLHTFSNDFRDQPGGMLPVKGDEFAAGTEFIYPEAEQYKRHLWIEVRYKRKLVRADGMKGVLFVVHAIDTHRDSTRTYEATRVKEYPVEKVGEWMTVHHRLWLPDAVDADNLLKVYLWNREKEEFYLDDYEVKIQVPRW